MRSDRLLERELERLLRAAGITRHFEVQWRPTPDSDVEGRVEEGDPATIIIHSKDIDSALDTLRHEIVDYIVSDATKPYLKTINSLLSVIAENAYQRKENSVESLLGLLAKD